MTTNQKRTRSYRDLQVWRRSYQMALALYRLTQQFPEDERYGLVAQIRRAAVSIPSNLAEGHARGSRRDYVRFLRMANGSIAELETQLSLACDLRYCTAPAIDPVLAELTEIGRMVRAMIRKLGDAEAPTKG